MIFHSRIAKAALAALVVVAASSQTFAQGTWSSKAPMPTHRLGAAAGVVNGILYVVGGLNQGPGTNTITATVEAYDPATNTWTTKAPMPRGRFAHAAGVIDGKIYVVGGISNNLTSVDAYDPATDTWTTVAPMPTGRYYLSAGVVDGILYAIGGANFSNVGLGTVEAYDPVSNTWSTKASMPTARGALAAAEVNGIIYAVSGLATFSGPVVLLATNEAYDPVSNSWSSKAPKPTAKYLLSASGMNGILYAVGGYGFSLDTMEAYDPTTNTWSAQTPMITGRGYMATAVVGNELYAIGGFNGDDSLALNEAFTASIPDTDGDGLLDTDEAIHGTNPNDPDSDDDGLLDGTEVDMAQGGGCPSPLDSDSDNDGLSDGAEVTLGTSPCNADTDGDGVNDALDPTPLVPGVPASWIESRLRADATGVMALALSVFDAPNNNARAGRRNAISNKLSSAANMVADGNLQGAIDELTSLLQKLDGEPSPPDWMVDGPDRDALRDEIELIIALLGIP